MIRNFFTTGAFIFLLLPMRVFPVSMNCVSVGPSGDVTISWDQRATLAADFRSWHVYYSTTAAGSFTLIDSLMLYGDTVNVHLTANAANLPAYYFVVFESNNGSPSIYSDTIRAIGLNINNPGNGYANLSWNITQPFLQSGNYPYYYIYREYPTGVFVLIDSVDSRTSPNPMTYTDSISVCDDTVKYRIEVRDSSGCVSVSPVKKDRFKDIQVPSIPVLDSVSVDANGFATVSWLVSNSKDTRSYVVLQNPGLMSVDTALGYSTTFLSTIIDATAASQNFVLMAIDGCGNRSAPSTTHETIFLAHTFNQCQKSVSLSWSPYGYWGTQPTYNVFVSINGSPEVLIHSTSNTNFTDTNLISGAFFCYRVRAIDNSGLRSSSSNTSCLTQNFPPPPAFSIIRKVTVTGTDQILIEAYVDASAIVSGYQLLRSASSLGPFSLVGVQNINGVSNVSFTDNVETDKGPYYYAIVTLDSCGRNSLTSQISNSILLSGDSDTDNNNVLTWTDYSTWPGGVDRFNIYRSENGVVVGLPVSTVSSQSFSFIESVVNNLFSDGEFCYIIEAIEAPGNPNLFIDTSRSNEVCIKYAPVIFIPNAFRPGGYFNPIFYPSNLFVPGNSYSLDIFNRWGEVIFHTNDPYSGWDGSVNGKQAPEGVYVYRIRSKNPDKSDLEKVGSLTLIR